MKTMVLKWVLERPLVLKISKISLGSMLIGACAKLAIPLPFTPVPLAMQPHVILFLAIFLGAEGATGAVILFLLQGALGLPVFAEGAFGIGHFLGPRGGYLLGYLGAAYVTGYLSERRRTQSGTTLFCDMAVGNGIIYLFGAFHLAHFLGPYKAFLLGVLPFLLGDVFKLTFFAKSAKHLLHRKQS